MDSSIYYDVKKVMDSFGIPDYIWQPIAKLESSYNPQAQAVTGKEYSLGLFQINLMAHPEYQGYNLFDPSQNAAAIADLWNKRGVIEKALSMPIEQQAAYVWQHGSRPTWTPEKGSKITDLSMQVLAATPKETGGNAYYDADFKRRFETLFPGDYEAIFGEGTTPGPSPDGGLVPVVNLGLTGIILRGLAYGLIFIIIFVSLLQVVPAPVPGVGELKKVVGNVAK